MTRALALLVLLVAAAAAAGCCDTVSRGYVIDEPDPDLELVLRACANRPVCYQSGEDCPWPECRTACLRVLELTGDAAPGEMTSCDVHFSADGAPPARVYVAYDVCPWH